MQGDKSVHVPARNEKITSNGICGSYIFFLIHTVFRHFLPQQKKVSMRTFCLLLLVLTQTLFSGITKISSFHDVKKVLESLPQKALVVYDVDEVLTTYVDRSITPLAKMYVRPYFAKASHHDISILMTQAKRTLVDSEMPAMIKQLQDRGIRTLALTACRTGTFGVIPSMEEWRSKELLSFGISFERSFPGLPDHTFSSLASVKKHPPLYKKGILYVGGDVNDPKKSKGKVLLAFLQWIDWNPKIVLFFDDTFYNVKTVTKELSKKHIPCKGYFFKRPLPKHFSKRLAHLQFETLFTQKKWLSDEEAKRVLYHSKHQN